MLNLEPKQIWSELSRLFPEIGEVQGRILDIGFRSIVAELSTGHICLIGRHQGAVGTYEKEFRILPKIQNQLPYHVPSPDWFTFGTEVFRYGAERYRKIDGVPLTRDDLEKTDLHKVGTDLGWFLGKLHSISATGFEDLREPELHQKLRATRDGCLSVLRERLSSAEYDLIEKWFDTTVEEFAQVEYHPVPIHGDLWYENIIVDEDYETVLGILDFETFAVGDPAKDFAPFMYVGKGFLNSALDSYGAEDVHSNAFRQRIQRYWEFRELAGISHCVKVDDWDELEVSITKVQNGPILNPTGEC